MQLAIEMTIEKIPCLIHGMRNELLTGQNSWDSITPPAAS